MADLMEKVVTDIRHDRLVQIVMERFGGAVDNNGDDRDAFYAALESLKAFYPDKIADEIFMLVMIPERSR